MTGQRLFGSKLERFILKRIAICALLSLGAALFFSSRWLLITGLLSGTVVGVLRFYCNAFILKVASNPNISAKPVPLLVIVYTGLQLITILLLYLLFTVDRQVFTGCIIGLLYAPLVVIVNILTELCGVTKNDFCI